MDFQLLRRDRDEGMHRVRLMLITTGVLLWVAPASSQAPVSGYAQNSALSAQANLVLVPAMVTTRSGELVFTLTAQDFIVTDDGVQQKVTLEEDTGDQPLALVVAIETGGAAARQLKNYGGLGSMVEAAVGAVPHRVAIVAFDSAPRVLQDFTPDNAVMRHVLQSIEPGDRGAAILDALAFSVDLLRKQLPQYRRAILLISETTDHGSKTKLDEALRAVSDTNTAIYSVAFSTSKSQMKDEAPKVFGMPSTPPGPPGGCMGKEPDADSVSTESRFKQAYDCLSLLAPPLRIAKIATLLAMNQMRKNLPETVAKLTGGEYFSFNNNRSLERGLLTVANRIPNRYMLSFHPQAPHPGLHSIQLRLKDYPNLVVKARSSYWVDANAATPP